MATAHGIGTGSSDVHVRINQLDRACGTVPIGEFCRRVDALRSFAQARGHAAVATLAGGLSDELARDGRGALIRPYLERMHEAAATDGGAPGAGTVWLAAVGVRLG